ncbi:MAG: gliding motility protein GldC [Cryomorphaceae bacterium]
MSEVRSEITFTVHMDENQIPEAIQWKADGTEENGVCDAAFLSIWDKKEKNTLKIDLWTKDMMVEDMQMFFHQMMLSMSDTYKRATGDEKLAIEIRQFALELGEKMNLIKRNED